MEHLVVIANVRGSGSPLARGRRRICGAALAM